jgi:hypothetical protein
MDQFHQKNKHCRYYPKHDAVDVCLFLAVTLLPDTSLLSYLELTPSPNPDPSLVREEA